MAVLEHLECLVCTEPISVEWAGLAAMCELCEADPCAVATHPVCLGRYFQGKVKAAYHGTCPRMTCLYHSEQVVPLAKWGTLVQPSVIQTFERRASEMLLFQCGSCDARGSISDFGHRFGVMDKEGARIMLAEVPLAPSATLEQVLFCLKVYSEGRVDHMAAYAALRQRLPDMQIVRRFRERDPSLDAAEVKRAQHAVILCASMVADPERRATLILYHLRKVPRFTSVCCGVTHCFTCQSMEWHHDQTCAEFAEEDWYAEMVRCGGCGTQLTKGDGCDSVVCVCGYEFKWKAAPSG